MNKKQKAKDNKKYRENKKRKGKKGLKILLIIMLLLLIGIGWFTYKTIRNGGGLSGMLATVVGHDENTKKDLKEIKVLVLGVSTDLDSELTDTIMVASYNPNTQKANLLSIPRDTFTGKNSKKAIASQKINSLYNINRTPEKTLAAINELTGLDIKYYVVVKTEALIKLVDAIGGVTFNVPIDMKYDDPTQDLHINLKAGEQVLNGDKAEQLLRWRHSNNIKGVGMTTYPSEYGNDDFGRMRTQRDFIIATLKQTLKPSNIFKIGQILEIAHENVETNVELSVAKDYIPYAVELDTENITSATLPGTTPNMKDTNNVSIFVADKTATKELIQSMFYSDVEEENVEENTISNSTSTKNTTSNNTTISTNSKTSDEVTIELLNGCSDNSKVEEAKKLLEDAGYKVKKTGKTSSIAKTIITNKKNASDEDLKNMKQVLGTGNISTNKSSTSLVDVTIIIGKDF
ncbi:MAG: LCP family protein [Clostridia bacterium]